MVRPPLVRSSTASAQSRKPAWKGSVSESTWLNRRLYVAGGGASSLVPPSAGSSTAPLSGVLPDNGAVDEPADGGTSEDAPPTETYNLRFNHVLSETEPFHAGFLDWADAVEERTNGGLTIDVYPSAQLGVEEDIIEQMKNGVNVGQNTD